MHLVRHLTAFTFIVSTLAALAGVEPAPVSSIDLAGQWRFSLGSPEPAFPQAARPPLEFADTIELPGTTETRGKGALNEARDAGQLTRVRRFDGLAWYERDVEIPAAWAGKRILLRFERSKYSQVWLDGGPVEGTPLFGTPQIRDVTALATPGRHTLTVMVDNRTDRQPVRAQAHQFVDAAGSNWNGLLGKLELAATDPVWLDDVQIDPDVAQRAFRLRVRIGNLTTAAGDGTLTASAVSFNHAGAPHTPAATSTPFRAGPGETVVEFALPLGDAARLWDEFSPALYSVTLTLTSAAGRDERVIETGLREFGTRGTQFVINGRPTFLRGKQDACIFPLTGHPPMDVAAWERYFRIVKAWGFNHVRCHTWIPPEAAFAAADRVGIYFQPELPFWGTFDAHVRDVLMPEALALLREYGNHPSFAMMTLANEAGGDRAVMNGMVEHLRTIDSRHLYTDGSNNVLWDPVYQATSDFFVSAKVRPPANPARAIAARGSMCVFDGNDGHVQWGPAETRTDFSAALAGLPVPFVGHETGQWTVYPDYAEIAKYTGPLQARNLERFRDSLARHGMLDQAGDFRRASGALAAQLYREENELAFRTPGVGGFQVLDLQDNPEQGTALVGLLDSFMDSKGIVTPEEFRRGCGPVVPLARFDRYTWTTADTYVADLQLAHYGAADWHGATTAWALVGADGRVAAQGEFPAADIAQGGLRELGRVEARLAQVAAPARYDLEVTVTGGGERVVQRWPVWVYPESVDTTVPSGVALVRTFDARAKSLLAAGRSVVLVPDGKVWANTLPGGYATDFWNWPMFNGTPGTMGLLCDPAHPVLAGFPTRFHSERQWTDLAHASMPVILTGTPDAWRPLVQVIDNYERNEKLGLIFEASVGPGRLLVCAIDLYAEGLRDKPETRQLLASLLGYAASDAFAPRQSLEFATLDSILRPSLAQGRPATASSSFTPPWGFVPKPLHAVDGDINTRWRAAEGDATPWLAVDLGDRRTLDTIELVWGTEEPGYCYLLEGSGDGTQWAVLSDQRTCTLDRQRHLVPVRGTGVRHIRVTITDGPGGRPAVLRELRVLGQ